MYLIEVIDNYKIVKVILSGSMQKAEVLSFTKEMSTLFQEFQENEYSLLVSFERLDPLSQDSLPILIESMNITLSRARRIATVFKKVVTRMQFQRLEYYVDGRCNFRNKVLNFSSIPDAFYYLKSNR